MHKSSTITLLGICAIASSIFCVYSCQFFSFRTLSGQPWEGLVPPFNTVDSATVGFFAYSVNTQHSHKYVFGDGCIPYADWAQVGQNTFFTVSQWCGIFAPVAAILGCIVNFIELCCCTSFATYLVSLFFFLAALLLQGGTFAIFGDNEFW